MPEVTLRETTSPLQTERPEIRIKTQPESTRFRQLDKVEAPAHSSEVVEGAELKPDPRTAAFVRREQAIRAEAVRLKAESESLKAEKSKYETDYVSKAKLRELAAKDPYAAISSELGLSVDQLANLLLNPPKPEQLEMKNLHSKIAELEEAQNKTVKTFEESQQKNYEQAVSQIRNDVKQMIESDARFETIKSMGSEEAVVEYIVQTFNEDSKLLSLEEAANEVEDYLVGEAVKIAQIKKVQSKISPSQPLAEAMRAQSKQVNPGMKTLTNAQMAPSSSAQSPKERKERAILAFKGLLK